MNPERPAPRRRRTTSADRRRRPRGAAAAASPLRRRSRGRGRGRSGPASTRSSRRAARGRRVLRDGHPAVARRRRGQRHAPGARRHAVVKQFYYYDVAAGWRERGADPFRRAAAARRNSDWHHMGERRRHLDARQVGVPVVRGLGPGVPRARADAGRPGLRQAAARPDAAGALPAPEADRSPPTSGTSATSTRRCTPGPRSSSTARKGAARPGRHRLARARRSTSCCSTSPGGSTARTASGKNVFEGGFLGLDNIGVFDRSAPLPTGGYLEQADGTAWMALFCQNMLEIALELAARSRPTTTCASSSSSTSCGSPRAMVHGRRRRRDVGRGGRVLLRRARACRTAARAAEGPLDGRAAAALRGHGLRRRVLEKYPGARAVACAGSSTRGRS